MKIKQLLTWIQDNNIDSNIDNIINTHPQTIKTIGIIEAYIDKEFERMLREQNEIEKRMYEYRKSLSPENNILFVEDNERYLQNIARLNDLNMIVTFIEKHKN